MFDRDCLLPGLGFVSSFPRIRCSRFPRGFSSISLRALNSPASFTKNPFSQTSLPSTRHT